MPEFMKPSAVWLGNATQTGRSTLETAWEGEGLERMDTAKGDAEPTNCRGSGMPGQTSTEKGWIGTPRIIHHTEFGSLGKNAKTSRGKREKPL